MAEARAELRTTAENLKGELLNKRLNVSTAVLWLEQLNLAVRDDSIPSNPGNGCGSTRYTAAGTVVSQGVGLGFNVQAGKNLNLAFGYTYVRTAYKARPQQDDRYGSEHPSNSRVGRPIPICLT